MDNEYLANEITTILEQRSKKLGSQVNNSMFWRLIIILSPFLFYAIFLHAGDGAIWKCNNCQLCQWQASNHKDWKGDYRCNKCGEKR